MDLIILRKRLSTFRTEGGQVRGVSAESQCENLMSDVYAGYGKAIREANQFRIEQERPEILALMLGVNLKKLLLLTRKKLSFSSINTSRFIDWTTN